MINTHKLGVAISSHALAKAVFDRGPGVMDRGDHQRSLSPRATLRYVRRDKGDEYTITYVNPYHNRWYDMITYKPDGKIVINTKTSASWLEEDMNHHLPDPVDVAYYSGFKAPVIVLRDGVGVRLYMFNRDYPMEVEPCGDGQYRLTRDSLTRVIPFKKYTVNRKEAKAARDHHNYNKFRDWHNAISKIAPMPSEKSRWRGYGPRLQYGEGGRLSDDEIAGLLIQGTPTSFQKAREAYMSDKGILKDTMDIIYKRWKKSVLDCEEFEYVESYGDARLCHVSYNRNRDYMGAEAIS